MRTEWGALQRDKPPLTAMVLVLALILLLAALLRVADLGTESYWIDEMSMIARAEQGFIAAADEPEAQRNPLYLLFAKGWFDLFGASETATRTLSALFGIMAVAATAAAGWSLFDSRVGLLSGLLMALSEYQIYHAQNFRPYSLFALLSALSALGYWRILNTPKRRDWIFYAVVSVAAYYTHAYAIFVLAAQALHFVLRWRAHKAIWQRWLASQIAILLLIAPGLISNVTRMLSGLADLAWMSVPTWYSPALTLVKFILPGRHLPPVWAILAAAGVVITGGALTYVIRRRAGNQEDFPHPESRLRTGFISQWPSTLLLGLWLVLPIAMMLIFSYVFSPMYTDRYCICVAPALYILLALGITLIDRIIPIPATLLAFVVLVAPGLHEYYVTPINEQWRDAAIYVQVHNHPGDTILVTTAPSTVTWRLFSWYYAGNQPVLPLDGTPEAAPPLTEAITSLCADCERVWLVIRESDLVQMPPVVAFIDEHPANFTIQTEQALTGVYVYLVTVAPDS
jgi:4-amino-4-deoxy-L-arabinose transferase-like glycosyltransferase